MALSLGEPGTADSIEAEYSTHELDDSALRVHMHLDAVDGIARDVLEGFKALPRRGVEVGGLLLGHVEPGEQPVIWIDRYQRIECEHRYGPQFVLDEEEHERLDRAAGSIAENSELNVVGFYRSHTRPGFQPELSDLEIVTRYFSDPSDILLLIKPENMIDITGRFFRRDSTGEVTAAGDGFPFRGHVIGPVDLATENPDEQHPGHEVAAEDDAHESPSSPAEREPIVEAPPDAHAEPAPPRERGRRLVPDFFPAGQPDAVRPSGNQPDARPREFNLPAAPSLYQTGEIEASPLLVFLRRWWPLFGALALVGGAMWFLFQSQSGSRESHSGAVAGESANEVRPLGLYVDASGPTWRVSWNPAATALRGARAVALFVRDGEDQTRIDLTPQDLSSGTYSYQPRGQDVTFRLEVNDSAGRLSAESFRTMKAAPAAPAPPPAPAAPISPPKAIHKVPPVVPASIRPRIKGAIPIDVRVHVDTKGRVIAAAPVTKPHAGLQAYLAERAVYAAKAWRFEPARQNGKPVEGTETIHFVFER